MQADPEGIGSANQTKEFYENKIAQSIDYFPSTQRVPGDELNGPVMVSVAAMETKKSCWYVNVAVNNVDVEFLVDSGAEVSLIDESIWNQIKASGDILDPSAVHLKGPFGGLSQSRGQKLMVMRMGNHNIPHTFVVGSLHTYEGILGMDFLGKFCKLDLANGLMEFLDGDSIKMYRHSENCIPVRINKSVVIPANSCKFVNCKTDVSLRGREVEIQAGGRLLAHDNLFIPFSVVSSEGRIVEINVVNVSPKPVHLHRGIPIAVAHTGIYILCTDQTACLPTGVSSVIQEVGTGSPKVPEHLTAMVRGASTALTGHQVSELEALLLEYQDTFVGPDGKLGLTHLTEHTIDTGDTKPIKQRPRRMAYVKRQQAKEEVNKMLENDVIRPSVSPWASPVVLVQKKDGSVRFCVDFRLLNAHTKKDSFPLPRIDEALESLGGATWFSTLDLASGYWQVAMSEEDKTKTAFVTQDATYEFNVLPFGLCNAPSRFARLMQLVLQGVSYEQALVYLDDIIVIGRDFTTALENLRIIFDKLRRANLKLKPSKCNLFQKSVEFLGHIVTEDGIKCDPKKIEAIKSWPRPRNASECRSLLGICGYYRKFYPNYAEIASPINDLTKKSAKFVWTDRCEQAFQTLRDGLTSELILAYPDPNLEFILDTDASSFGISGILSQVQNGEERVIAYGSRTLSRSERNYCTTNRELLAVVTFIKAFRHYLYGQKFTLRTDHHSLIWLSKFKDPEGMIARWLSRLSEYDFTIVHRKGQLHGNADGLSRKPSSRRCPIPECQVCRPIPDYHCPVEQCEELHTVTHPEVVKVGAVESADPHSTWVDTWTPDMVKQWQMEDPDILQLKTWLSESRNQPDHEAVKGASLEVKTLWTQWQLLVLKDGILYRRRPEPLGLFQLQLVVPVKLRGEIMRLMHSVRPAGHFGITRTLKRIQTRFYWPRLRADVERWCKVCFQCARRKDGPGKGRAALKQDVVSFPNEKVAIDIMGPLPTSENGNAYIMVVIDYFTKWAEAYALPNHTAQTVADMLVTEYIARFGTPYQILTDRGPEFQSELFRKLCEALDIDKIRTTPYRPQSDGLVERCNRTIKQQLAILTGENEDDWEDHLPYVLMAYRATVQESTGCTPNLLMLGREVTGPLDLMFGPAEDISWDCPVEYVQWVQEAMSQNFQRVKVNTQKAANRQKKNYDRRLKVREFKRGDWVFLFYPPLATKLGSPWQGPYLVVNRLSNWHYQIQYSPAHSLRDTHVDNLKPCTLNPSDLPDSWLDRDPEPNPIVPVPHTPEPVVAPPSSDNEWDQIPLGVDPPPISKRIHKPPSRYSPDLF